MKKLRPEVEADYKSKGSIGELLDNAMIAVLNITLKELDFISDKASDDELGIIMGLFPINEKPRYSEMRKALEIRDKYLKLYNQV